MRKPRKQALSDALDEIETVWLVGRRPPRSPDPGVELAKAVVEYFGTTRIDPLLISDIAIRNLAKAIVAGVK